MDTKSVISTQQLWIELLASGWPNRKLAVIGARYYNGIESDNDLQSRIEDGSLTPYDVGFIKRMR